MKKPLPNIKIPLTNLDERLEIISLFILVFNLVLIIYKWNILPNTIPTHFNLSGQIQMDMEKEL